MFGARTGAVSGGMAGAFAAFGGARNIEGILSERTPFNYEIMTQYEIANAAILSGAISGAGTLSQGNSFVLNATAIAIFATFTGNSPIR